MKLIILFFTLFGLNVVSAQKIVEQAVTDKSYSMTFDAMEQDFGKVKHGDVITTTYKFENTGTEDIKIEIVSGCECTTLDWPRKVIKPGEKGEIEVIFDSGKKEESETVDIDVNLENVDPKTGYNRFEILSYTFELVK
jgi:hypothetical protein